jgi:hypothetical protein
VEKLSQLLRPGEEHGDTIVRMVCDRAWRATGWYLLAVGRHLHHLVGHEQVLLRHLRVAAVRRLAHLAAYSDDKVANRKTENGP